MKRLRNLEESRDYYHQRTARQAKVRARNLKECQLLLACLILGSGMINCGPGKPDGSDYVGMWEGAAAGNCECWLDISRTGESYVLSDESSCLPCKQLEGILTLTPEGNLVGEPVGTVVFDAKKERLVVSTEAGLRYLRKLPEPERGRRLVLSGLSGLGFEFGAEQRPMCEVEGSGERCRVEAFVGGEKQKDSDAFTCAKLRGASYVGECADGALEGLAVLKATGSGKVSPEVYVANFSQGRILYPALSSFVDTDTLNLGIDEGIRSYGCIYFGRWDSSHERTGCLVWQSVFGDEILSEKTARALKTNSFDLAHYSEVLAEALAGSQ